MEQVWLCCVSLPTFCYSCLLRKNSLCVFSWFLGISPVPCLLSIPKLLFQNISLLLNFLTSSLILRHWDDFFTCKFRIRLNLYGKWFVAVSLFINNASIKDHELRLWQTFYPLLSSYFFFFYKTLITFINCRRVKGLRGTQPAGSVWADKLQYQYCPSPQSVDTLLQLRLQITIYKSHFDNIFAS